MQIYHKVTLLPFGEYVPGGEKFSLVLGPENTFGFTESGSGSVSVSESRQM